MNSAILLDLEDTIKSEINETVFQHQTQEALNPNFPNRHKSKGLEQAIRGGRANRQGWLLSYGIKRIILQGDGGVLSAALEDARGE
jgi:hypothetical protein